MQRDETKEEVVSRSRMASTLLVPPSKHTLFMRGFSARQDIEKIRDFYRREAGGGECTVEFFKESENREKLFVALRFDTKDIAKDILNRFDNTEVLGDRVTISWFKDLRRARQKGSLQGQPGGFRGQWQQGNKPFHFHHKGQPFFRPRFPGQFNQRFKFIPQDGSGGENVGQRGMSPLRNGFRPGQFKKYQKGYDNVGNRGPDNWRRSSQSRHRSTSLSHSRSRSRSRSYSSRSRSRSHSRSRSRSHSHSDSRSRSRSKSRGRTHSKTPESKRKRGRADSYGSPSSVDRLKHYIRRTPDRDDSRDRDHSPDTRREDREEGDKRDWDHSPDRYSERKDQSSRERSPGAVTDKYREHSADRSVSRDREKSPETSRWDRSPAREDQRSYHDNSMEESPPRRSFIRSAVKTVEQHKGDEEEYEKPEERYYEATYERPSRSRSPGGRSATVEASPVPAPPPPQDYDRLPRRREDSGRKRSLERSDEGYIESIDIGDKRRRFQEESLKDESPNRGGKGGMRVLKRGRTDQRSDDGLEDDHASHMSSPQLTTVNGVDREVDRGALGLPPDKMVLVRQKKEEIERAYRQDCETFASVVKMLISKDHELEGRMQDSLRENLKEIGQRCIQELREFIEKLKSDDVSK